MAVRFLPVLVLAALFGAGPAGASTLIGQNATDVHLAADASGRALVTFKSGGTTKHVLASGASDSRQPSRTVPQVEFKIDYRGGSVRNSCSPVNVAIAWRVAACRAPDGSYWALQSWQRLLPNTGATPSSRQAVWELRLSHWKGPLAALTIRFGWAYKKYLQLYGLYTYAGKPVFGYKVTRGGQPQDGYGRNVYVDAFDSDLGKGWKRVNSFLARPPVGGFCYGFYPYGGKLGVGPKIRATAIGPSVTPDVMWQGTPPAQYDSAFDSAADDDLRNLLRGDTRCRPI